MAVELTNTNLLAYKEVFASPQHAFFWCCDLWTIKSKLLVKVLVLVVIRLTRLQGLNRNFIFILIEDGILL